MVPDDHEEKMPKRNQTKETGSEDDGLLDLSDDDFFLTGSSSEEVDADDEWTKSTRERASSIAASGMSSDERNQVSARALMPPSRPSSNSFSNSVHAKSRFGSSSSRNSSIRRTEMSTSSNTSKSSSSSFKAGESSNSKTGNNSNLSSNSDARKPRRKILQLLISKSHSFIVMQMVFMVKAGSIAVFLTIVTFTTPCLVELC
ncbi:hypothetical protein ES288_D10G114200v1 [Gossypium darwinii]|nr:hypothetical protein ES288_D10G114200v1 [Gossypium darwinii]TYH49144.1 hypothetical protein ES332_D10G115900v1 [Gossypium tomentosum]